MYFILINIYNSHKDNVYCDFYVIIKIFLKIYNKK